MPAWIKVTFKVLLGALAAAVLCVGAIFSLLVYESSNGQLDGDNYSPVYVASDPASFAILQELSSSDPRLMEQAERQTSGRIFVVGSGTHIRIKDELYFDGKSFLSGFLLSPAHKARLSRVYKVEILDRSSRGQIVFVPAEQFHTYGFM